MADRFDTTRWSLIADAGGSPGDGRSALAELCRQYRPPVLAYVRAHRASPEEAEDLTQAFFAHLLEHQLVARADPSRGRFRAFLLTSLKNFLASDHASSQCLRRGGGMQQVEDDGSGIEASEGDRPEQIFEREWARTVLQIAMRQLEDEARLAKRHSMFLHLRPFLLESPTDDQYEALAITLQLRRNTVAVAVHRLRTRLQEVVRKVVGDTARNSHHAAQELRQMRAALMTRRVARVISEV